MRWLADLRIRQEGMQYAKVRMSQSICSRRIRRQVDKITENDVYEDVKIVGVEVLSRRWIAEQKVQSFEDQQLEGRLRFSIEKKNQVAPEGLVCRPVRGKGFNYAIGYACTTIRLLGRRDY
jgi:hypothetical protein